MALLVAAIRADRFSEGTLLSFFENGYKIELFVTDDGLIIPKLSKSEHKANSVE